MDKFDDIIKSKIEDYILDLPPGDSLHPILDHLNKRNSKKKLYYLTGIAASFIALLTFAGVIIYQKSGNFKTVKPENPVIKVIESNKVIAETSKSVNNEITPSKGGNYFTQKELPDYIDDITNQDCSLMFNVDDDISNDQHPKYPGRSSYPAEYGQTVKALIYWESLQRVYMFCTYLSYSDNSIEDIKFDTVAIRWGEPDESYFIMNSNGSINRYNFYEHNLFYNTYAFYAKDTLYTILSQDNKLFKEYQQCCRLDRFGCSSPYLTSIYSLPSLIQYIDDAINCINSRKLISYYETNATIELKISETFYQLDKYHKDKLKSRHLLQIRINKNSLFPENACSEYSVRLDEKKYPTRFDRYHEASYTYEKIIVNKEFKEALWSYNDYRKKKKNEDSLLANIFEKPTEIGFSFKGDIYEYNVNIIDNMPVGTPLGTFYTNTIHVPNRLFTIGFPGVIKRSEWFMINYNALFNISDSGRYYFRLSSDDGSMLVIDHKCIIDNMGAHGIQTKWNSTVLDRGVHAINIKYYQGSKPWIALLFDVSMDNLNYEPFDIRRFSPVDITETKILK
jgi:hypothetical protein